MNGFSDMCLVGGAGAFCFVLTWLLRGAVSMAFVDRPLVIALCAGWWTGQWEYALPLGLALELFWLDVIPLGAVTPPAASFAYLIIFSMQLLFPPRTVGQPLVPLFAGLGFAYLSAALERQQRLAANAGAALLRAGQGNLTPDKLVHTILLTRITQQSLLYLAAFSALSLLMTFHALLPDGVQRFLTLPWSALYGLGVIGAVVALRLRKAYWVWGAGCLLLLLERCLTTFL